MSPAISWPIYDHVSIFLFALANTTGPQLFLAPFLTSKYQLYFRSDVELRFFENFYPHFVHIFKILCLCFRRRQNVYFSSSVSWSNENTFFSNIIFITISVKDYWNHDTSALWAAEYIE